MASAFRRKFKPSFYYRKLKVLHLRRGHHLCDNFVDRERRLGALHVELTADDVVKIDAALPPGAAEGTRYPAASMAAVTL